MRLTWRDGATTVLAGLAVAIVVAVTREWNWPIVGSVAAGIVALGVVGWSMCALGGSTRTPASMKEPFTIVMSVLGGVALVVIVVGLITRSETALVALAAVTVVMWLASTTAHVLRGKAGTVPQGG